MQERVNIEDLRVYRREKIHNNYSSWRDQGRLVELESSAVEVSTAGRILIQNQIA